MKRSRLVLMLLAGLALTAAASAMARERDAGPTFRRSLKACIATTANKERWACVNRAEDVCSNYYRSSTQVALNVCAYGVLSEAKSLVKLPTAAERAEFARWADKTEKFCVEDNEYKDGGSAYHMELDLCQADKVIHSVWVQSVSRR